MIHSDNIQLPHSTWLESRATANQDADIHAVAHVSQTKATAFVEQIGSKTRARLNFVEVNQTSSEYGQTSRHDTPILDAKLYQNAFEKIENAIFIRSASN